MSQFKREAFVERKWKPAQFISQEGLTVKVRIKGWGITRLPYQDVRHFDPDCMECGRMLKCWSFQTHAGTSLCPTCYLDLDDKDIQLLFGGYQWLSWGGQIAIRDMEESHLVNTVNKLKRSAEEAAEAVDGHPSEYLSPHFPHLINELRRRRPEELSDIKMNAFFLYIWSVIYMLIGRKA